MKVPTQNLDQSSNNYEMITMPVSIHDTSIIHYRTNEPIICCCDAFDEGGAGTTSERPKHNPRTFGPENFTCRMKAATESAFRPRLPTPTESPAGNKIAIKMTENNFVISSHPHPPLQKHQTKCPQIPIHRSRRRRERLATTTQTPRRTSGPEHSGFGPY